MEVDSESECVVDFVDDCMVYMMEVEGIEYCMSEGSYDDCTGEEFECNAEVMVSGQWYNETCDVVMEMFGIEDEYSDNEDECEIVTDVSCGLEDFLDHCVISGGYDSCLDEEICNVEWMVEGET